MASRPDIPEISGPGAASLQRGYEARDVRASVIVLLLAAFALFFAGLCGGLWLLYRHDLKADATGRPASVVPASSLRGDAPPLQPQVGHESLDAWDLSRMRAQEDATFGTLGWARDENTHRFVVPSPIVEQLRRKYAASVPTTQTAGGGS